VQREDEFRAGDESARNEMLRSNQKRWWTLGHYQHEPLLIYRFASVGVLLAVAGFASAAGSWLWTCHRQRAAWNEGSRCACQLHKLDERVRETARHLKDSNDRTNVFQQALQDKTSPFFAVAREQIQNEKEISRKLNETAKSFQIQSLREFSIGLLALLIPTLTLSFVAGRLMLAHAHSASIWPAGEVKLTDWHRPYLLFVVMPFAVNEASSGNQNQRMGY